MSAAQVYRQYKNLSRGIFVPVVEDENQSAAHYKRVAERFRRCALKRISFQENFVQPEERDFGHAKAIESALQRSDEAKNIYIKKNLERLNDEYQKIDEIDKHNYYHQLQQEMSEENKENEYNLSDIQQALPPSFAPVVLNQTEEPDEDQILRTHMHISHTEKMRIVAVILDIISAFWKKTPIGDRDLRKLILFTWCMNTDDSSCNTLNAGLMIRHLQKPGVVQTILIVYDSALALETTMEFFETFRKSAKSTWSDQELDENTFDVLAAMGIWDYYRTKDCKTQRIAQSAYSEEAQKFYEQAGLPTPFKKQNGCRRCRR